MSFVSSSPTSSSPHEAPRQQMMRCLDEIAQLSETELAPPDYYREFLQRVLSVLPGSAAAIWGYDPTGRLQLHYQINLEQVGLERDLSIQKSHDDLLRQARQQTHPVYLPPRSSSGPNGSGRAAASNSTDYGILLAPIILDAQVAGLIEIFHGSNGSPCDVPVLLAYLLRLAGLASSFLRNSHRRELIAQQQLWTQMETFSCQVHGSLDPGEVAYTIANGARRLVGCDRISIALRHGRRTRVTAISGCDVVEKRSNLVQRMRILAERVLVRGETMVYAGTRDARLPPRVVQALDAYLAESSSKLLVVLPLRDDRERDSRRPPRCALLMESFEPAGAPDQALARLEVIGRHAASALYNAGEYRRIPCRWLWRLLAGVQEGVGGRARAAFFLVVALLGFCIASLIVVPYPLKMDARGQLLPQERCWVYAPVDGQVVRFAEGVEPGTGVSQNQSLVLMYDVDLELKLVQLESEISGARHDIAALARQEEAAKTEADRIQFGAAKKQKEFLRDRKILERAALRERTHADDSRPGYFWLKAPITGTILNRDFQEKLRNRHVQPAEPLLRIGNKDKPWEIELQIPQRHIGQVLQAFNPDNPDEELDVDLLLMSWPTRTFKGKLARARIAGQASPNRDNPSDAEPVVLASVRLDGPGIRQAERIPPDLLVTGTEVHCKIRCGDRPLGYALFYGVWEFFYEKVAFFFAK